MTISRPPPPDAVRYLKESRLTPGRKVFEAFLVELREHSVKGAIYSQEETARSINAGRAQAWTEIVELFTK